MRYFRGNLRRTSYDLAPFGRSLRRFSIDPPNDPEHSYYVATQPKKLPKDGA
jgi:hypothetical protein